MRRKNQQPTRPRDSAAERALRVLHVSQPANGGVAAVVRQFASDQQANSYSVGVAAPSEFNARSALEEQGVNFFCWDARRAPGPTVIFEIKKLRAIVNAFKPDVVHLHSSKAGLAGRLLAPRNCVLVFQPHAWSFQAADSFFAHLSLYWERYSIRSADATICVSEAERDVATAAGLRGCLTVIRNGVDVSLTPPISRASARVQLGLGDAPTVVCVGRVSDQKGQDLLLAMWPAILGKVPNAQLVFVGDGADRLDSPDGMQPFRFAESHDLSAFYRAADVVAVPSRWEGMALVPLEAMALCRAVVAFDVQGIRESVVIEEAIARRSDITDFADKLIRFLLDEKFKGEVETANARRMEQQFDSSQTSAQVRKLYGRLLAADVSGEQ